VLPETGDDAAHEAEDGHDRVRGSLLERPLRVKGSVEVVHLAPLDPRLRRGGRQFRLQLVEMEMEMSVLRLVLRLRLMMMMMLMMMLMGTERPRITRRLELKEGEGS
jgi:hypothetical protein